MNWKYIQGGMGGQGVDGTRKEREGIEDDLCCTLLYCCIGVCCFFFFASSRLHDESLFCGKQLFQFKLIFSLQIFVSRSFVCALCVVVVIFHWIM